MAEIGARVAQARKLAGLTQGAVAEVLGTDKTAMSKIEHGRRRLDGFELALVAERLGTTARELLGLPSRRPVLAIAARLGSDDARTGPAIRRAQQLLELDALADELELSDAAAPARPVEAPPTGTGRERATMLAAALRNELGLGVAGIGDLVGLCERSCGLDVAIEPLGDGPSGLLVHHSDVVALALLNADDRAARQRFTLAHELGHHLFGDPAELIVEDGHNDVDTERRADRFAIELLLPEAAVQRSAGDGPVHNKTVVDGMIHFGVSREAYVNRLQDLRIISSETRQSFLSVGVRSLFAAAGRSADFEEWAGGVRTRRAPKRMERRLLDAYRAGRIGIGPVAQLVGRDADDLRGELDDAGMSPTFSEHDFAFDLI